MEVCMESHICGGRFSRMVTLSWTGHHRNAKYAEISLHFYQRLARVLRAFRKRIRKWLIEVSARCGPACLRGAPPQNRLSPVKTHGERNQQRTRDECRDHRDEDVQRIRRIPADQICRKQM